MCVISMVMDHFGPQFDQWIQNPGFVPGTVTVSPSFKPIDLTQHLEAIEQLIKDFRLAVESAKKVDSLTAQPDCVDPEKAKLEERVSELEARIAEIEKKSVKKTKKYTKKGK